MTNQKYLPEETLIRKEIEALMDALGPVETARFLALPRYRYADTVEWHRQWQETLDPTQFFDQVFGAMPSTAEQGSKTSACRRWLSDQADRALRLLLSIYVSDSSSDLLACSQRYLPTCRPARTRRSYGPCPTRE